MRSRSIINDCRILHLLKIEVVTPCNALQVLIEAVQNHSPDVILCDEIGCEQDADAARTVKNRGVRIVAGACGDLRTLVLADTNLKGLLGVVETARSKKPLGNDADHVQARFRVRPPVFDCIIELRPGSFDEWTVITDVPLAVDKILAGQSYEAQIRRRDQEGKTLTVEFVATMGGR